MMHMLWPVLLIGFGNALYHLISRNIPSGSNAFLTLVFSYTASAAASFLLFLLDRSRSSFSEELGKLHPASCLLGIVIVTMEIGGIYLYRTGWPISRGALVAHTLGAIILLIIGSIAYNETISIRQVLGVIVCIAGLTMITL